MMRLLGFLVGQTANAWAWFWRTQARTIRILVLIAAGVLAVPPITQYWMSRVRIPDVPLSTIIGMAVATAFMVVFGATIWLLSELIRQLVVSQRIAGYSIPRGDLQALKPTGGSFIPTDDAALRDAEDRRTLKSMGILQETDVEGLASEIGHAHLLKTRGRTE